MLKVRTAYGYLVNVVRGAEGKWKRAAIYPSLFIASYLDCVLGHYYSEYTHERSRTVAMSRTGWSPGTAYSGRNE